VTSRGEAEALTYAEQRGWISGDERARAQASGAGSQLLGSLASSLPPTDAEALRAVYARAESGSGSLPAAGAADDSATIQPNGPPGLAFGPDDSATIQRGPDQTVAAPRAGAAPGSLGPYTLIRELARGGMGAVWIAKRPDLDREVALKVLLSGAGASEDEVERFLTEARISARLRHPAIVSVLDVGQEGGRHYLAMDLIKGGSLKERLSKGPLAPLEAAELFLPLAEGLAFAHAQAVLHRDLKPHNVLIDESGQPLLTDFGLAKDTGASQGLTKTGQVMGTPAYMPPEQAEGASDLIDRRSDVYGLGATLYEALTGAPPFRGSTPLNVIHAVLTKDPEPPRAQNSAIPRDLETIVLTCLEKEPDARYPSAQALADDLRRYLNDEPIAARPPTLRDRARKWRRRHPTLATLLGAVLVLGSAGGVGGVVWTSRAEVATRERTQARLAKEAQDDLERLLGSKPEGPQALLNAQSAFTAAQRWQALAPRAPEAYAALRRSVTRLQEAAFALGQWQAAQHANEQLDLLAQRESVPESARAELLAYLSERAQALTRARAAALEARRREIRAGLVARRPRVPLPGADTRDQVLVWLVRQGRVETRAALLGLGEEFAAALVGGQREFYERVSNPLRSQALGVALQAWLGGAQPGSLASLEQAAAKPVLIQAQRDMGRETSALKDLQGELAQAFPESEPAALLELVCQGIGHLLGEDPQAVQLLVRLALLTSASPYVEHPLRGLLAARAPTCAAGFKAAIELSGGSREVPIDVFEGFTLTYERDLQVQALTPGARGKRINQAALEFKAGRLSQALHLLGDLSDANARLLRGQVLVRLGLSEGALRELNLAGNAADSNLALQQRAEAWRLLGCHQLALGDAILALEANPKDAKAWFIRASVELDLFKLQEARVSVRRLLGLLPEDPLAQALAIKVTRRLGDLKLAARLVEDGLSANPENPWLLVEAARVHLAARDAKAARALLPRLKASRAPGAHQLEIRAHVLALEGDFKQARAAVRQALSVEQDLEALMLRLNLEPKNASASRALLRSYPGAYFGHYQSARQRAAQQDLQGALDHLSAVLYLRPREVSARRERIRLALSVDANELALADLDALPSEDRQQTTWHTQRAAALIQLGRAAEGLEVVRAARRRWAGSQRLILAEAAALRDLKRVPEARTLLQKVLAGAGPADDKEEAARMLEELR
jgi:protein kinase-like protein